MCGVESSDSKILDEVSASCKYAWLTEKTESEHFVHTSALLNPTNEPTVSPSSNSTKDICRKFISAFCQSTDYSSSLDPTIIKFIRPYNSQTQHLYL